MNDTWRRVIPLLVSIIILVLIALLRARSKAVAAITATMPINIALGLWIVYVAEDGDPTAVVSFVRSMFVGIVATALWLLAVWVAARAGWGLGRLLGVGYAAWAAAIALILLLQSFLGGPPILPR